MRIELEAIPDIEISEEEERRIGEEIDKLVYKLDDLENQNDY